jgi:hypothetical protein
MGAETILATLPGHGPHQRLVVALRQRGEGGLSIELRDQHHGEGIGWFDQRTLSLDPRQWQQLQAVLGRADAASRISEAADETPATIAFPGPRSPRVSRPAIGDGF